MAQVSLLKDGYRAVIVQSRVALAVRRGASMSRKSALLIASLLLATSAFVCLAQVEQGAIAGAVVDSTGASMPKAKVTATNQATRSVAIGQTTDHGYH